MNTEKQRRYDRIRRDYTALSHPRVPGTDGSDRCRDTLVRRLRYMGGSYSVAEDEFERTIGAVRYKFSNIMAVGTSRRPILLVAHRDSLIDYTGAIDAATCMAVMLELAREFPDRLSLAFVDGEEPMPPWNTWSVDSSMSGSFRAVRWFQANQQVVDPCLVIVLDLWGFGVTSGSRFEIPQGTDRETRSLYYRLHGIENELYPDGHHVFNVATREKPTQDDSFPFQVAGYTTIDLLPLPFPSQWHDREEDHPANVDREGLARCYEVLRRFIETFELSDTIHP